ncbi:hypothetical protein BYT27DRAFT_7189232 [Phlegmacium glaucopus]|nr:hypothetical protein BYT27DRAFT_7189232 [Phlegmacium glaucopus]
MTSSAQIIQINFNSSCSSNVWGDIIERFQIAVENIVFRIDIIFKKIGTMSVSSSVSGSKKLSRVTIQASSILSTVSFAVAEVSPLFAFAFNFPFCFRPCPSFPPPSAQQSAA